MPNSAEVQFNEIDMSFDVANIIDGVAGVMGETQMGPVMRPDILINTWALFQKYYGGFLQSSGNNFPLLCFRALTYYGLQLRVCSIKNLTDITDIGSLTARKAHNVTYRTVASPTPALGLVQNVTIAPIEGDGGTFAAGSNVTYGIYASNANGNTLLSAEHEVFFPAGPNDDYSVMITWNPLVGATGYTIVRINGGVTSYKTLALGDLANAQSPSFEDKGTPEGFGAGNTPVADTTGSQPDPVTLGAFTAKYPGSAYNDLNLLTKAPSNGLAGYFDLQIFLAPNRVINTNSLENYPNLKIIPGLLAADQLWAKDINNNSYLVSYIYADTTELQGSIVPILGTLTFSYGDNGQPVTVADYTGDPGAKTGIYAFDGQDDMFFISAPVNIDPIVGNAGAVYASARKDLVYFCHLDHTIIDPSVLITARNAINNADSYTAFFTGGVKIADPVSGQISVIEEMGDVLGIHGLSDQVYGSQFSAAGTNRGIAKSVLGCGNQFGSKGNYVLLNQLANSQINCMITSNNKTYISGNFTGQISSNTVLASKLSFLSIRKMLINVKDNLAPAIGRWLEEPADIPTFSGVYREVKPLLEALKTNRSVYDYRWYGDQNVTDISKIVINNQPDLDLGKITAQLWVKPINSTQWIITNLYIVDSAYSFEDSLN